jgi:hypothetical protein
LNRHTAETHDFAHNRKAPRHNGKWLDPQVAAALQVYLASEHGKVVVLRAAGDWEILAINEFDSGIYATPAVSKGQMYIRTRNALYAIGRPISR